MLGRRKFLGTVGATAVALAAARTLRGAGKSATPRVVGNEARATNPLAEAGVAPKARFGRCDVVSLEKKRDGSVGVRLSDSSGQPFEVELLAYDPRAPGVARAGSLSVYMNNHGDGATATVEEHGLAAMALARHLARSEARGAKLPALPSLLERSTRAPA